MCSRAKVRQPHLLCGLRLRQLKLTHDIDDGVHQLGFDHVLFRVRQTPIGKYIAAAGVNFYTVNQLALYGLFPCSIYASGYSGGKAESSLHQYD